MPDMLFPVCICLTCCFLFVYGWHVVSCLYVGLEQVHLLKNSGAQLRWPTGRRRRRDLNTIDAGCPGTSFLYAGWRLRDFSQFKIECVCSVLSLWEPLMKEVFVDSGWGHVLRSNYDWMLFLTSPMGFAGFLTVSVFLWKMLINYSIVDNW